MCGLSRKGAHRKYVGNMAKVVKLTRAQLRGLIREAAQPWIPAVSGEQYKQFYGLAKEILMGMEEPWEEASELLISQLRDDLSQAGYEDDDGRFG